MGGSHTERHIDMQAERDAYPNRMNRQTDEKTKRHTDAYDSLLTEKDR